jgi:hypothetical protein
VAALVQCSTRRKDFIGAAVLIAGVAGTAAPTASIGTPVAGKKHLRASTCEIEDKGSESSGLSTGVLF